MGRRVEDRRKKTVLGGRKEDRLPELKKTRIPQKTTGREVETRGLKIPLVDWSVACYRRGAFLTSFCLEKQAETKTKEAA